MFFIHELTLDVKTYSEKNNVPLQIAQNIVDKHTSAEKLGKIFSIARPETRRRHPLLHKRLHNRQGIRGYRVKLLWSCGYCAGSHGDQRDAGTDRDPDGPHRLAFMGRTST